MKITYNSPVILTFTLLCTTVMVIATAVGDWFTQTYFAVGHPFVAGNPLSWIRMFSHIAGHGNWPHLFGNFTIILLVGPMLEENTPQQSSLK